MWNGSPVAVEKIRWVYEVPASGPDMAQGPGAGRASILLQDTFFLNKKVIKLITD